MIRLGLIVDGAEVARSQRKNSPVTPMFRNEDNDRLAGKGRSSVCKSSVMNLGENPRVLGAGGGGGVIATQMPRRRSARNHRPSHESVKEILLRCLPIRLTHGEGRKAVASRFHDAMKEGKDAAAGETHICGTPLRWIKSALSPSYHVTSVRSLDDIMGAQGMMPGVGDFFLMDVILNRELVRSDVEASRNPDDVVMASAKLDVANLGPNRDFMYRTVVAYLPGAGVFYCARERRPATVVLENTPVHHDVSWLRITEDVAAPPGKRFSFGEDGFVRRFTEESTNGWVSAWRVSHDTGRTPPRFVFPARQCSDSDGPRMPPDIVVGIDISAWPGPERGAAFNSELASSKAAKVGGRHHAKGCLHTRIPDDCLVIDQPHVDIVVDIAPSGSFKARKSVVRVRNLLSPSMESAFVGKFDEPLLKHELRTIVLFNAWLRKKQTIGLARSSQGDVGAMHPVGTRVLQDGKTTTSYAATHKVPRQLVEAYVKALSRVGQIAFPDVLAVSYQGRSPQINSKLVMQKVRPLIWALILAHHWKLIRIKLG